MISQRIYKFDRNETVLRKIYSRLDLKPRLRDRKERSLYVCVKELSPVPVHNRNSYVLELVVWNANCPKHTTTCTQCKRPPSIAQHYLHAERMGHDQARCFSVKLWDWTKFLSLFDCTYVWSTTTNQSWKRSIILLLITTKRVKRFPQICHGNLFAMCTLLG